ncbi:BTAD domain-containing putative transcriptional regulator [Streptomyces sp. NPDC058291]|uniref:AfsR/SARP family transcriptional regulator n=1 Tax=Streptomyces sp. NPDC058291 TaxID=3346427 RepID=UPI0036E706D1
MPADAAPRRTGDPAGQMRFEVLGPVRVWRDARELDPGFPQQRALLALLLAHTGRPVPPAEILDVLWGERPPASAPNVVRRYAGALRRLLEPGLAPRAPGRRLLRSPGGYLLEADTDEVDLLRFRDLTRRGKRAAATGRTEAAADHLVPALGEWRGPVAMGIPESVRARVQFTALRRELLDTARLAADAALLCGRAEQVLPVLRRAVAQDPLDEPLHARLVLALAACGLQAEALGVYDDVRRRLVRDLNVAPGPELTAAHTRVLRQEVGRLRPGPTVRLGRPAEVVERRRSPDSGDADAARGAAETAAGRDGADPGRADGAARGNGPGDDDLTAVPAADRPAGAPEAVEPDDPDDSDDSDGPVAVAPRRVHASAAASGASAPRSVDSTRPSRSVNDGRGAAVAEESEPRSPRPAHPGPSPRRAPGPRPRLTSAAPGAPVPSAAPVAPVASLAPVGPPPPATAPAPPAGPEEAGDHGREPEPTGRVRPAQLPAAPAPFVGRAGESRRLEDAVDSGAGVVSVCGMAGVGKSALVLGWAHRIADGYPDGRLYVSLRGFDGTRPPVEPADALRGALTALGVPPSRMPDGVGALTGLYRTVLSGRRVLVVLDDAAGTEQVRPLLPAAPGSLALVTSRPALPGLVASGARALSLGPLSAEDARASLVARIGAERTAAEPGAVDAIVARCGGLPLALAAVGARAAGRREFPLAALADELRAAQGTLDALPAVRAAFLGSYRRLEPDGARLLLLLPRHGDADLTPAAAAALAGLPVRRTRSLLAALADAHLLTEHAPGRYALHELVRAFAAGRARTNGPQDGV